MSRHGGWENLWDCCSCCWLSPCWREPRSQRRPGNNKICLLLWFICIFLLAMYVCLPPLQDDDPTADGTCLIFKNNFSNLWICVCFFCFFVTAVMTCRKKKWHQARRKSCYIIQSSTLNTFAPQNNIKICFRSRRPIFLPFWTAELNRFYLFHRIAVEAAVTLLFLNWSCGHIL